MIDMAQINEIVESMATGKGALIPLLQELQETFGYVPEESIDLVAGKLGIFPVEIYGVLTFYAQFRLSPPGRHTIKVCQGTACYIMGGKQLLSHLSDSLGIDVDETTDDGRFSLERVACLGCCGMGPVIMIDETFHSRCTVSGMASILDQYD